MKKLLLPLVLSVVCTCAYSQDNMNKKMENKTDKMNKKLDHPRDPMVKKLSNGSDSTRNKTVSPDVDSAKRRSKPKL